MSEKKWFYSKSGEDYQGPVSRENLSSKIKDETIPEDALVWKEGFNEWKLISEIPEFEDLFEGVTPPPLPKRKDSDKNSTDFHKEITGRPKSYEEKKRNKEKFQSDQLGKLPEQIKCPICEDNLELAPKERIKKRFWCPTCKNDINEGILRKHKGVNPKLFNNKTKKSEGVSTSDGENNLENQDTLTHKWLKFYINIRIPLSIFFTLVGTYNATTISYSQSDILIEISAVIIIVYAILFWGLYKRELWGWRLNWWFIFLEPFGGALGFSTDPNQILIALLVGLLVYTYPNYIYFKKRRYLFS